MHIEHKNNWQLFIIRAKHARRHTQDSIVEDLRLHYNILGPTHDKLYSQRRVNNSPKRSLYSKHSSSFKICCGISQQHIYVYLTSLLTQLLKKRNFQWTNRAEHTFQHLKEKMSSTSLFVLSNFSMSFKLMTDAFNSSVGTTLIQQEWLVAYYSQALSLQNQTKATYEKELMIIILAV